MHFLRLYIVNTISPVTVYANHATLTILKSLNPRSKNNKGFAWKVQAIGQVALMGLALAEQYNGGQIAIYIQTDMQPDRPLGFPKGIPWKKRAAEVYGGGGKQIEFALELDAMGQRGKSAAALKELEKHRLIEKSGLLLVFPGRGSPGTGIDGQMMQLV